jgi:hypothetical protein
VREAPAPGLCGTCLHVRVVVSGKGSRFYLCQLAAADPTFPKYPQLPVLACRGYRAAESELPPGFSGGPRSGPSAATGC